MSESKVRIPAQFVSGNGETKLVLRGISIESATAACAAAFPKGVTLRQTVKSAVIGATETDESTDEVS